MSEIENFDRTHAITISGGGAGAAGRELRPGDVIGGSYILKSLLGRGGMGYVFCAEHNIIKHEYALKMLVPEQLNQASRLRFETEGRAIAKLDHVNIVKVYNMGLDGGDSPFYVMDLLAGKALSEYIAAEKTIPLNRALDILIQISAGLGYAHNKGIVHRDVKPSNIVLLSESDGHLLVKIVDFGIAKLLPTATLQSQALTAVGDVFGSPLYMSPEQCLGDTVDGRSDIYSLGCTFFEMLTGAPPFRGVNAMETVMMQINLPGPSVLQTDAGKDLPSSVDLLLTKMMAKRPQDRYQTMAELSGDLKKVARGENLEAIFVSRTKISSDNLADPQECDQDDSEIKPSVGAARSFKPILLGGLAGTALIAAIVLFLIFRVGSGRGVSASGDQATAAHIASPAEKESVLPALPVWDETTLAASVPSAPGQNAAINPATAWDGKPFFKGTVDSSGRRYKVWQFPDNMDPDFGILEVWSNKVFHFPMQGTVKLPASETIRMVLNATSLKSPELINGFTDGNFDEIGFLKLTEAHFDRLAALLARFRSITGLGIDQIESEDSIEQKCVDTINRYPRLTHLTVSMLSDGRSFGLIKRLKMLEDFTVYQISSYQNQTFNALKGSTHLARVVFMQTEITAAMISDLSTCPNLKEMSLSLCADTPSQDFLIGITDGVVKETSNSSGFKEVELRQAKMKHNLYKTSQSQQIALLAGLKQLSMLQIEGAYYTPSLLDSIDKLQSLTLLKSFLMGYWSPEQVMALRKALPYARHVISRSIAGTQGEWVEYPPLRTRSGAGRTK